MSSQLASRAMTKQQEAGVSSRLISGLCVLCALRPGAAISAAWWTRSSAWWWGTAGWARRGSNTASHRNSLTYLSDTRGVMSVAGQSPHLLHHGPVPHRVHSHRLRQLHRGAPGSQLTSLTVSTLGRLALKSLVRHC